MSKLEQLIQEMCPGGVKYKKLIEITTWDKKFNGIDNEFFKGYKHISAEQLKKFNSDKGTIKLISTGNFEGYAEEQKCAEFINEGEVITLPSGGTANIKYYSGRFVDSGNIIAKTKNSVEYNTKFVYYCLINMQETIQSFYRGSSVQHPDMTRILNVRIPVPPLEVQCEIVHILDHFTLLTTELTAELTVRKAQYEYYSSKLFENCNGKIYTMEDVAKFVYGYTDKAKDIGDTRFIRITDIDAQGTLKNEDIKYIDMNEEAQKSLLKKGDIVMARTGATYGKTLYFNSDVQSVYASFLIKIIPDNNILLNKYYWHFTKTPLYWEQANKLVTTGGQPQFNTPALKQIKIQLPTLEEQQRIIDILDKLDKMCTDISEGLPAEIEARQKQYEYYRDKLLTFKELKKEN